MSSTFQPGASYVDDRLAALALIDPQLSLILAELVEANASTSGLTLDETRWTVFLEDNGYGGGSGYQLSDVLSEIRLFDSTASLVNSRWYNLTQGTTLSTTPNASDLRLGEGITKAQNGFIVADSGPTFILPTRANRKGALFINDSDRVFYGLYSSSNETPTEQLHSFSLAAKTASPLFPTGARSSERMEPNSSLGLQGFWESGATGGLIVCEYF